MVYSFTMMSILWINMCPCWIKFTWLLQTQIHQHPTLFLFSWLHYSKSFNIMASQSLSHISTSNHSQIHITKCLLYWQNISFCNQHLHRLLPFWNTFTLLHRIGKPVWPYIIVITLSMTTLNYICHENIIIHFTGADSPTQANKIELLAFSLVEILVVKVAQVISRL